MLKKSFFTVICLGVLLTGCRQQTGETSLEGAKTFEVAGVVREIAADQRSASIQHEEIPGYMMAMTMTFNIRNPEELQNITAGDAITFRLVVTETEHWIDQIKRVGSGETESDNSAALSPTINELAVGDLLPDYALLDENGETIHFSDFRGKVLAFTFIFTRCPIPEYCPLMSNHFASVRKLLNEQEDIRTDYQLLSISFDPDYDTPAVLKTYADRYRSEDSDQWLFASAPEDVLSKLAPELDLMLARDVNGSISHNLRTVVLDAEGRIAKQFDGNFWTPEQMVEAIVTASAE